MAGTTSTSDEQLQLSDELMEKIDTLKSSELSDKQFLFKINLSFIEKGWLGKNNNNVITDTYKSLSGHIFSSIVHFTKDQLIERIILLIDDKAPLNEIDVFLDKVVGGEGKLSGDLGYQIELNLQSRYADYVVEYFARKTDYNYGEDPVMWHHEMFVAPATTPGEITVPQGYVLGPLKLFHVEYIAQQWARNMGLRHVDLDDPNFGWIRSTVSANITERPCCGIFTDENCGTAPIAWLSIYGSGSIGQLHVLEEHRGKGLARALIRHTLKTIQNIHGMESRAHATVRKGKNRNIASFNLFSSEGWELQPVNHMRMLFCKSGTEL